MAFGAENHSPHPILKESPYMFRCRFRGRGLQVAALGVAFGLCARPAATDPRKDKWEAGVRFCSSIYARAAQLEEAGKLRQARDVFLSGAKAQCVLSVRQQCMNRYRQLDSEIPSVIPVVTGE